MSPASVDIPLFETVEGTRPLVISMPHSGTHLPADIEARIDPSARDLPDTDWFVPRLYEFHEALGASVIRATHSRYVVDLNRPPDGAPLYPGQRETTVCPIETFDGQALYAPGDAPGPGEIAGRLRRYWQPYHERLRALIDARIARHGYCFVWDAHSILSTIPALFAGRLPDLNLGTAGGRSCRAETVERVGAALRAQHEFTHVIDGRFQGGYITRHYGDPARAVEALQLEIAQSAYLREARVPRFDAAVAAPLIAVLRTLLTRLLEPDSGRRA